MVHSHQARFKRHPRLVYTQSLCGGAFQASTTAQFELFEAFDESSAFNAPHRL